jgi:hypothetical protein
MIGLPGADEENNGASRMSAEPMVVSLAIECARLCSDKARSTGVKSEGKYQKRESEAKMKHQHYHVQDNSDVSFLAFFYEIDGAPSNQDDSQRITINAQHLSRS